MPKKPLPEIQELLRRKDFWNEKSFFRFVEYCNAVTFESPKRGLELARHAPAFAAKVAARAKRPALILLTGDALLASAYRAVGAYRRSDETFAAALLHTDDLSDLETADLKRRMSYLRLDQRRFDEALALIDEAIAIYRRDGDLKNRHFLGCCYVARATIHWERGKRALAVVDLTEALNHLRVKQDPKVYYSAVHNLAVALADCRNPRALETALGALVEAQRRIPFRGKHVAKSKLKWLLGLIHIGLGSTRHGERLLYRAREELTGLGAAYEVALISLDLALLYLEECREAWEIEALAAETCELFRDMSADQEALAALAIWQKAAAREELTEAIVRKVRTTVAERTTPSM